MNPVVFCVAVFAVCLTACQNESQEVAQEETVAESRSAPDWQAHPMLGFEVIRDFPHDATAFTQGLLASQGEWIEGTGGYGKTTIRRVGRESGKVLAKHQLPANFFGEGVAELDGKIFQLTWKNQQGFIYEGKSLQKLDDFSYEGEGWGLTSDASSLIMSNGTDRLRYLDPQTFRVWRELSVRISGKPVNLLNELEFIEGEIFANVWHTEKIVRINPKDGNVVGVIDLTGINAKERSSDPEHVLNGIAYDSVTQELFVTGKCWPKIYQIRLVPKK